MKSIHAWGDLLSRGIVYTGGPRVEKRLRLTERNRKRVLNRVFSIRLSPPDGVAPIRSHRLRENCVVLSISEVTLLKPTQTDLERFTSASKRLLQTWRKNGFVHGDLSPNNLGWDGKTIFAFDWLADLNSRAGTPAYSHPKVARGIHDFESDAWAMSRVKDAIFSE